MTAKGTNIRGKKTLDTRSRLDTREVCGPGDDAAEQVPGRSAPTKMNTIGASPLVELGHL